MWQVLRAIGLGILGFVSPRVLVGAGLPIDQWAIRLGQIINPDAPLMNTSDALTSIGLLLGALLISEEFWVRPLVRFVGGENIFERKISLRNAAIQLYDSVKNSYLSRLWEQLSDDESALLDTYANFLVMDGPQPLIDVFGKREPFNKSIKIPVGEFTESSICDGATTLRSSRFKHYYYCDLTIRKGDFRKRQKTIREKVEKMDGGRKEPKF